MINTLIVGLGGVIGALLRYYLGLTFHSWWTSPFPYGTLTINLIGAFVLAYFNEKIATTFPVPEWLRLGFGTGLAGAFTTFSTFSVETVTLFRQGLWAMGLTYVMFSLVGGLLLAYLGYWFANLGLERQEEEVETV